MIQTIGHRGAAALEPENTLRSFRKAIELGMDYVEFDIRRCKSGELVVIHDETVDRTTDGRGLVAELTLHELKKLDAGKGERIPTLQEVIECCKGKAGMVIELKEEGLEKDTVAMIEKNGAADNTIATSFFHERVKKAKEAAAAKGLALKAGIINLGNPVNAAEVAEAANADIFLTDHYYTDERLAKRLREAGIKACVGRCDSEDAARKALRLKPDMMVSDNPEMLMKVLGR